MARLQLVGGCYLEIRPVRYQFPHLTDYWDGNWLNVFRSTNLDGKLWKSTDPVLTTWELQSLADWCRRLAENPKPADGWLGMEPDIWIESDDLVEADRLAMRVSLRFDPSQDGEEQVRSVTVEREALRVFARELEREAEHFPQRGEPPAPA